MRLIELVGTMVADGAALNAWRIAQEFWSKGELVPKAIWQHVQANASLIQANLAEERESGIYVSGSSEYLSWVAERRLAASAGGKQSAKKRAKAPSKPQPNSKQNEANGNQTQPSGSSSSSVSKETSTTEISSAKKQEARFRFAKEIKGIEASLATMFDGLTPKDIVHRVPDMILACDGDPESVLKILEDLYQSPKIRTGEGLEGSKANYIAAAIAKRFGFGGAA